MYIHTHLHMYIYIYTYSHMCIYEWDEWDKETLGQSVPIASALFVFIVVSVVCCCYRLFKKTKECLGTPNLPTKIIITKIS